MPGGRSLRPGETLVPDRLALTLETIAREGVQAFYRGSIARQIAEACAGQEGFITLADLAAYQPVWGPSLRVRYRDHEIHSTPWPSGGAQFLETFSLLAGFDLSSFGLLSTDHIHTFLETMKIAQADRMAHKGDPTFDPSTTILDDSYAARRSSGIDMRRAAPSGGDEQTDPLIGPTPVEATAGTNTTHLVAADRHGNLVSLTQSLGRHFGSRVIAGETGILMNSMGRRWSMPGIPAAPAIALAPSGAPAMTVGGVGPLIQAVPQMISNVIDFHLNPQAALEAPRFRAFKGFRVMMEARIPQSVRAELASRGHQCDVVGEWAFGEGQLSRGQMIIRDRSGALYAGSDPRGDGAAQAI
jgi:gamma-glutamyltranspeptidase/glutathione hydrolase